MAHWHAANVSSESESERRPTLLRGHQQQNDASCLTDPLIPFTFLARTRLSSAEPGSKSQFYIQFNRGVTFEKAGLVEEAIADYTEAISQQPDEHLRMWCGPVLRVRRLLHISFVRASVFSPPIAR